MMKSGVAMMAAILVLAAGPAEATDWWLVSGAPGEDTAIFADAETLARRDDAASVRVLRIDRSGRSAERLADVRCSGRAASREEEAVRRFACASAQDRDQFGLILASMSPDEVARMIFGTGSAGARRF